MAPSIKPYKIAVPDAAIERVKAKLALSTYPKEEGYSDDWEFGAPRTEVMRLAQYWKDGFDWRAQEAELNKRLPQFMTEVEVDGFGKFKMHFVHQKSSKAGSIPLLFSHGWPGSFLEVIKILPLLTEPKDGPSFHIVAPSLPNFGFSDGAKKKDFGIPQYAEAMHKVMLNLGYNKYVTQGGDWGFIVTRLMAVQYPDNVLATHLNFVRAEFPPSFTKTPLLYLQHALQPYTAEEKTGLQRTKWFSYEGYGYNLAQSTKPNTIGFALADSPVALLAWIYEKLHDWTDNYPWTDDEILTWICIYQFSTAGPAASARIYYENIHSQKPQVQEGLEYQYTPLGLSYFPRDLVVPPSTWGRTLGTVVFEKRHKDGGHFASHERPEWLAEDLREMFGKNGGARKVAEQFQSRV